MTSILKSHIIENGTRRKKSDIVRGIIMYILITLTFYISMSDKGVETIGKGVLAAIAVLCVSCSCYYVNNDSFIENYYHKGKNSYFRLILTSNMITSFFVFLFMLNSLLVIIVVSNINSAVNFVGVSIIITILNLGLGNIVHRFTYKRVIPTKRLMVFNIINFISLALVVSGGVFLLSYEYVLEYKLLSLIISILVYIFSLYILYLYEKSVIKKNTIKE